MEKGKCVICGGKAGYRGLMCEACLKKFDWEDYHNEVDYATYDIEDNKLRIYSGKVVEELYAALATVGYQRAYKQGCFYAVWDTRREDVALALCGQIDDEDSTLEDRAADRADRFAQYSGSARQRANSHRDSADHLVEQFQGGQPILLDHYSAKRALRDQERAHNHMRASIEEHKKSSYWRRRAESAIAHAEYKSRPDVVKRRLKRLKADKRKYERDMTLKPHEWNWTYHEWYREQYPDREYNDITPFKELPVEMQAAWAEHKAGIIERRETYYRRWLTHVNGQIEYWQAIFDANTPPEYKERFEREYERGMWALVRGFRGPVWGKIMRVNKSRSGEVNSVSVDRDNLKGDTNHWSRKWKPAEILALSDTEPTEEEVLMSASEFLASRKTYTPPEPDPELEEAQLKLKEINQLNQRTITMNTKKIQISEAARTILAKATIIQVGNEWHLDLPQLERKDYLDAKKAIEVLGGQWSRSKKTHVFINDPRSCIFEAQENGYIEIEQFDYFPTPQWLVCRMVSEANPEPTDLCLEPSAGDGRIADEILRHYNVPQPRIILGEINDTAAELLKQKGYTVEGRDFMEYESPIPFDIIIANPPFSKYQDAKHFLHAWDLLADNGRMVFILSEGNFGDTRIKVRQEVQALIEEHGWSEKLPDDTFKDVGTLVKTRLVVVDK